MAHDRADDDRSFLKRKGRPNANPRANPERQIGKAVNRLTRIAEKPVRIEIVGFFPKRAMAVEHVGCDDDHGAGLDRLAGKLVATESHSANGGDGRIEAVCLVDHRARFNNAIGKTVGGPA